MNIENGKRDTPNCIQRQDYQNNIKCTNRNLKNLEGLERYTSNSERKKLPTYTSKLSKSIVIIERETKLSVIKTKSTIEKTSYRTLWLLSELCRRYLKESFEKRRTIHL